MQPHINAIYFVRPTQENIKLLCKELNPANQQPSFGQYFLFFSNHLTDDDAQLLAQADTHELVQRRPFIQYVFVTFGQVQLVHENWADFLALSATCADLLVPSLPCLALGSRPEVHPPTHPPSHPHTLLQAPPHLIDKLVAVCMALKRRPSVRFRSAVGRCVSREFQRRFEQVSRDCSGDFKRSDSSPLLLLIDRRDDLVTPIVRDWT